LRFVFLVFSPIALLPWFSILILLRDVMWRLSFLVCSSRISLEMQRVP